MMETRQAPGCARLLGCQMHHGIRSDRHGVLCGIGFGSTVWQCRVRDEMVEWSANNGLVICNRLFLQLREVRVLGLSSQALRLATRRVVGIPRRFAAIDRSGWTDRHLVAALAAACDGGICDTFAVAYPELASSGTVLRTPAKYRRCCHRSRRHC